MKKITAFLICMALTVTMFAWSEQDDANSTRSTEPERIHITPDRLQFYNNDMYVLHNDDWQQVFAVYSEREGLFAECKQPNPDMWYCPDCRKYHSKDLKECPEKKAEKDRKDKEDKKTKKQKKHR